MRKQSAFDHSVVDSAIKDMSRPKPRDAGDMVESASDIEAMLESLAADQSGI